MTQFITRLISGGEKLILPVTTGARTIAKAKHVFTGRIDRDFSNTNWGLDVSGVPTGVMCIAVHEMVRDGNFKDIFTGLTQWFTQEQVIIFSEYYANWLHPNGNETFLPFMVGEKRFVARVRRPVDEGGLYVFVSRFAFGGVWSAEPHYRVVIPQLTSSVT